MGISAPQRTVSERTFEQFLTENNLAFERIQEAATPRPDYLVEIGDLKLAFEVKELTWDESFAMAHDPSGPPRVFSRTLGEHVRKAIHGSRKQIQFAAAQDIPTILLLYNSIDPIHLFATDDADFLTAMYGELTMRIDRGSPPWESPGRPPRAVGGIFHGKNQFLSAAKNTSFSAVGRLRPCCVLPQPEKLNLTLFENVFAKVSVPYEKLPPCLDARRIDLSFEACS